MGVDKEVEDEDTVTGARVVDGDEDEEGVETILGRSKLRAAAEGLLDGDARYRGKKGNRRTLDQDLDGPLDQDMKEHMQAELGHMFGGGQEDDDEEDEDDDNEGGVGEEEEDDGEGDSEADDDCEEEQSEE